VSYLFMTVHYPEPGHRNDVYARMKRMAEAMAGTPGLIEIGPWLEHEGDAVVGLSCWESRDAFEAAMPGSGVPNTIVHERETRPRQYFHLARP
jgi:heme-degrading monooxygenase HmoA